MYLAAAQKAKCVACSSAVIPLLPTSSKSCWRMKMMYAQRDIGVHTMSFQPPGPANPAIGTNSLMMRNTWSQLSAMSFLNSSIRPEFKREVKKNARHAPAISKIGSWPACRILNAPLAHRKYDWPSCRVKSIAHCGIVSRELAALSLEIDLDESVIYRTLNGGSSSTKSVELTA
jgi:hypothetical protein